MFSFAHRVVFINNVDSPRRVLQQAERLVAAGVIDQAVLMDHAESALQHFGLTAAALGRGYVYSISELVSLSLAQSEYVLHFAGDSLLAEPCEWLTPSLELLEKRPARGGCRERVLER